MRLCRCEGWVVVRTLNGRCSNCSCFFKLLYLIAVIPEYLLTVE